MPPDEHGQFRNLNVLKFHLKVFHFIDRLTANSYTVNLRHMKPTSGIPKNGKRLVCVIEANDMKENRCSETYGIDPVHHTTMSFDHCAEILDTTVTLNR